MKNSQSKLFVVGEYTKQFNDIFKQCLTNNKIYQSKGLKTHVIKRHPKYVDYIDKISEIILKPDYIGVNENENLPSFELVKVFDENILVGIKLDVQKNYLYVSTLHEIKQSKLEKRLFSGRLKPFCKIVDKC